MTDFQSDSNPKAEETEGESPSNESLVSSPKTLAETSMEPSEAESAVETKSDSELEFQDNPADMAELLEDNTPPSRLKKVLRGLGWVGLTLGLLVLFTWIKLPDDKIKNYIAGRINSELSFKGISLTAAESEISLLMGLTYTMKNVVISFPQPTPSVKFDRLEVSPSLFGFLLKKISASVKIKNGESTLRAVFSLKDTKGNVRLKLEDVELSKLGILAYLADLKMGAVVTGEADLNGDFFVPNTLAGTAKFIFKKITLDSQPIVGFLIPKLVISGGEFEANLDQSKALIKTLILGKTGSNDDIAATVTGEMTLGKTWGSSVLNTKAKFSMSDTIHQTLPFLGAILGPAKQSDGSFAYLLTGTLDNIVPTPVSGSSEGGPANPTPPAPGSQNKPSLSSPSPGNNPAFNPLNTPAGQAGKPLIPVPTEGLRMDKFPSRDPNPTQSQDPDPDPGAGVPSATD